MNGELIRNASRLLSWSAAALSFVVFAPVAAQEFEESPTLRATEVLPANVVRGVHHTVDETVQNAAS